MNFELIKYIIYTLREEGLVSALDFAVLKIDLNLILPNAALPVSIYLTLDLNNIFSK